MPSSMHYHVSKDTVPLYINSNDYSSPPVVPGRSSSLIGTQPFISKTIR
ncbi:MAG: hypothetical protein ABI675_24715 [Chitinophagaceae bacterium]